MNRPPLAITTPAALRAQAATVLLPPWLTTTSQADLNAVAQDLENVLTQIHGELAKRAWRQYPRTYRSAA